MLKLMSILLLLSIACQAQEPTPTPSVGQIQRLTQFPSQYVPSRDIDVWLPAGYNPQQRYAVIYMQDGQMLFDASLTWNHQEWRVDEVAQHLISQGQVQPFIVVGIHNGGVNRHAEYFPQKPFQRLRPDEQQAQYQLLRSPEVKLFHQAIYSDQYLKFMVNELKPYIDKNFSVHQDKAHTFVMGSSMGGLISLYALNEYPDIFGGAACLSTHWPGNFLGENNPVPATFFHYLQQHLPAPLTHKIYFDYGDQTLDAVYPPLQRQVDGIMLQKNYPPALWQTRYFAGAAHTETAWANRLAIPLEFLLSPQ